MNHLTLPVRYLVMILILSTSTAGCTSLALTDWDWKSAKNYATPKKPAIEIVALWEPAEGKGVDGMPTRGFSGQIMFFQHNNTSPVYAKGDVMIHLYDDQGDLKQQSKPLHQYKFDAGAWQVHGIDSTLGPAYQVFIPYVRKGRVKVECALRVQLSQKNAPEIYSRMISVKLDGKTPEAIPQTLTQKKPAAKAKVIVDTLARRESGKQLELSPKHKQSQQERSTVEQTEIQQIMAEVIEPVVDERDERIHQLEDQMARLLNDQKQQSNNGVTHSNFNVSPTKAAGYRKFRLHGSNE
ncbi:hypothetical protein [uncultured Gimesia sp.]|uniref:hypothetical protein n=1 Tax=uncultured Gimesia sp. TaxID=1678688 RepID=UPI002607EB09|nr:hypothetical protein [uncultured Gimesia sp.]